jgi:hypothetical protein
MENIEMRMPLLTVAVTVASLLAPSFASAETSLPYDIECSKKTWNGSVSGHKTCRNYDGVQMCGACMAILSKGPGPSIDAKKDIPRQTGPAKATTAPKGAN